MGFKRITNDEGSKGAWKDCIVCGNRFFARQSNYVCCSTECSKRNNLLKHYTWQKSEHGKMCASRYYRKQVVMNG